MSASTGCSNVNGQRNGARSTIFVSPNMPPKITKKQRDTALTVAITVSSIGKDVAEMLGVPFAKGAASILLNILKTIQVCLVIYLNYSQAY